MRGVLNSVFLRFRSELATDEAVLHGTIRLDSKIRSENVHFHDSFWREQTLAATKLFLSLTGPITSTRTALIRDLFSYGFPRKLRAGPYGSYDKYNYHSFRLKGFKVKLFLLIYVC